MSAPAPTHLRSGSALAPKVQSGLSLDFNIRPPDHVDFTSSMFLGTSPWLATYGTMPTTPGNIFLVFVKIWYCCFKEGSVEETKGAKAKLEQSRVRSEQSLVGVRIRVAWEPLLYTKETRRSEGGTAASTYGLCHHVYTCPNLTLLVLCFPGQGRTKSKGKLPRVCQSLPEFCRTHWDCQEW